MHVDIAAAVACEYYYEAADAFNGDADNDASHKDNSLMALSTE